MLTKSILKIRLLFVNFEKFTSIITAFQTLDCDWAPYKFIEVNFPKLTDSNQIFRIDFVFINTSVKFHLKLSSTIFLLPMIFLK